MKKENLKSILLILLLIGASLSVAYLIFNIILFIVVSFSLLFLSPLFYAYLNRMEKSLSLLEIFSCVLFSVLISGYTHFITSNPRFEELVNKQELAENVSIQQTNVVTYLIGIAVYMGIFYLGKMKFNERKSR